MCETETVECSVAGHPRFDLVGDVEFYGEDVVLSVVLPLRTMKALLEGGENRSLKVHHSEVVHLLSQIYRNPKTSAVDKEAVKTLLKVTLESPNSTTPERNFIKSVLASA